MDNDIITAANVNLRKALRGRSSRSGTAQKGKALLLTWTNAPQAEQDETRALSHILEESFGYEVDLIHLEGPDLDQEIASRLSEAAPKPWEFEDSKHSNNPFILYYSGNAFYQGGEIVFRNRTSTGDQLRWNPLQKSLENNEINTAVILDCNVVLKSKQHTTEPLFALSAPRQKAASSGKLEIFAAPQGDINLKWSFTHVFTETVDGLDKPSSLKGLLDAMEELLGSAVTYENLSSLQNEKSMTLSPVDMEYYEANLDRLLDADIEKSLAHWLGSAPGSVKGAKLVAQKDFSQDDSEAEEARRPPFLLIEQFRDESFDEGEFAEWRQKCPDFVSAKKATSKSYGGNDSRRTRSVRRQLHHDPTELAINQWNRTSQSRGSHYGQVYVLPLLWRNWNKYTEWDAEGEINDLKAVIKTYFSYQVEETFRIPDDSTAEQALTQKILHYVSPQVGLLKSNDLFIVIYNGHGYDQKDNKRVMEWRKNKSRRCTLNWTNIVRYLDAAQCDVVQVLDCCYAGNAVKGGRDDLDHLGQGTVDIISPNLAPAFMGRNEIVASAGRDMQAPAGSRSSSLMFVQQLKKLAERGRPFTVYSWWHAVDTYASRRNRKEGRGDDWWCGPFWKMNPAEEIPRSIFLTPNTSHRLDRAGGTNTQLREGPEPRYLYAKFEEKWLFEMMRRTGDLGLQFCRERDEPQRLSRQ